MRRGRCRPRLVEDRNVVVHARRDQCAVRPIELEAVSTDLRRLPVHLVAVLLNELPEAEHRGRILNVEVILHAKEGDPDGNRPIPCDRAQNGLDREGADGPGVADNLLVPHVGDVTT